MTSPAAPRRGGTGTAAGSGWTVTRPARRGRWLVPARTGAAVASDTGDGGPLVVLVHGIGMSSRYLTRLHDALAPDRRVLVPDLPGYGASHRSRPPGGPVGHAAALAGLLDGTGAGPGVLVGHSMGAQVVTEVARRRPDLVRALVLLGPVVEPGARSTVRQAWRLLRDGAHEPPGVDAVIVADYLRCGPLHYARDLPGMLRYPLEDRLADVTAPTVLVRGGRDPICPAPFLAALAAARPGTDVVDVAGVGHVVMHDGAATVAQVCRRWP